MPGLRCTASLTQLHTHVCAFARSLRALPVTKNPALKPFTYLLLTIDGPVTLTGIAITTNDQVIRVNA